MSDEQSQPSELSRYVCGECGAEFLPGLRWCKECEAPASRAVWVQAESSDQDVRVIQPPALDPSERDNWEPSNQEPPARIVREERAAKPLFRLERSRWRRGGTTFGPIGRVFATTLIVVVVVGVMGVMNFVGGANLIGGPLVIPLVLAAGLLLREIWARDRVQPTRPEKPKRS